MLDLEQLASLLEANREAAKARVQIARLGAVERWRDELRRGLRGDPALSSTWTIDGLWAAAVNEEAARRAAAEGDAPRAREFITRALLALEGEIGLPTDSPKAIRVLAALAKRAGVAS